jgi:AcrR family transcriptional regulator
VPRQARFPAELLLEASERLVADVGPAALTIEGLSRASGAPVGSIYHRFPSRDVILARLWLRAVRDFQTGLAEAIRRSNPAEAALAAAVHTPRWCRRHPERAQVLMLYRQRDLVAADLPEHLSKEIEAVNQSMSEALADLSYRLFGRRTGGARRRCIVAVVDIPYGAVRRYLVDGRPVPDDLDAMIVTAVRAVLSDEQRANPSRR